MQETSLSQTLTCDKEYCLFLSLISKFDLAAMRLGQGFRCDKWSRNELYKIYDNNTIGNKGLIPYEIQNKANLLFKLWYIQQVEAIQLARNLAVCSKFLQGHIKILLNTNVTGGKKETCTFSWRLIQLFWFFWFSVIHRLLSCQHLQFSPSF